MLELDHVSKTFQRGDRVILALREVTLTVHAGEFMAVQGERSAGKTTLLRLAAGLEPPDSGAVRLDGRDLSTLSARELAALHRRVIAWVDRAGPAGAGLSVRDYVALPLLGRMRFPAARVAASEVLERVGALDCARASWQVLSDGERAHVAMAHALIRRPRVLVLDDPTASLDILERERTTALLRSVAETDRVAVLMAAPDLPAMLRAHDVRALMRGRLLSPPEPPPERGQVLPFRGQVGHERTA